jgi:hypothetical protein
VDFLDAAGGETGAREEGWCSIHPGTRKEEWCGVHPAREEGWCSVEPASSGENKNLPYISQTCFFMSSECLLTMADLKFLKKHM